jgi:hypothetical protein
VAWYSAEAFAEYAKRESDKWKVASSARRHLGQLSQRDQPALTARRAASVLGSPCEMRLTRPPNGCRGVRPGILPLVVGAVRHDRRQREAGATFA